MDLLGARRILQRCAGRSILTQPEQPEAHLACLKPTFKFFPGLVSNQQRERKGRRRASGPMEGQERKQASSEVTSLPSQCCMVLAGSRRGKP